MSEITVSRPEVVNENTDVVCSTSVRSRSLEYDNFPEISEANILSTFEQLHQNKDEVFERGVINVFKGLSWDYKTNSPCKFGSKIIVNNLVRWDQWGYPAPTAASAPEPVSLTHHLTHQTSFH